MATTDQTSEVVPTTQAPGTHYSQPEMSWKEFRQNTFSLVGSAIILTTLLTALFAPFPAPHDPTTQFEAPDGEHNPMPIGTEMLIESSAGEVVGTTTAYLGTDHHGWNILSCVTYGLQTLMTASFGVVGFAMALGVTADAIADYYRNTWVDEVVMRLMGILFSSLSLILAIAVIGMLGVGSMEHGSFALPNIVKVTAVIGVVHIPSFACVMRGSALKEMEEDYIDAAKSLGASDRHILLKDTATNILPTVVVQGTLYMGTVVFANAMLSFLGLGIQPSNASLGLMLSNVRGYLYSGEWWYSVSPGLVIVVTILGLNLLEDGLHDAFNPRNDGDKR